MCTRIFWNDNDVAKVTSRCMDWAVDDEPQLWFMPRGTERTGGTQAGAAAWRSTYSSVATSMWGVGSSDGMNEKGLAAHALFLYGVQPPTDTGRGTVTIALWVQYVLDNFSTVAEVIAHIDEIELLAPPIRGQYVGAHLALEDPSGDSAIIEPVNGEMVVHHGREFTVMANSPTYDEQLTNLARFAPFGGDLRPPGDITSDDRFVRASYFRHYLPEPASTAEAVAGVFGLSQNVAVPIGAPYDDGGVYPTWWHTVSDVTHLTYYFWSTRSPSAIWVDLAALADGTEVLALDPRDGALVGNVTDALRADSLVY
ncbi:MULTISPECIES: linear amide C-N hydrolase [Subtercola]|uniref:Linear amide C-N hydrolase n=1 Tax=Subtercola vilae TaxID=2056433 RepID=A0A4T2C6Y3_9MICO|nr:MULTISPECIES: linear amide C-N hydrolase [Subtercola]MEA9986236.1 linear amide C-N hydrolase [Subtercola sp. RTI3]TIH39061.1 linear amide C-N hydrolase [Subtercola vilae]